MSHDFLSRRYSRRSALSLGAGSAATIALAGAGVAGAPAAAAAGNDVVPIVWSSLETAALTDTASVRLRKILANCNRYAVGNWWKTIKNFDAQTDTYLAFGGTGEHKIRHPAAQAFSLAVSVRVGAYDAAAVGVSAPDARAKAARLARSLAYRHKSNTDGGWGDAWQSALWGALAGTAGWLVWEDLSTTDRGLVRTMVEHEANRLKDYIVPYYRNRAGTIISSGDSKGEENAWNSMILQVAASMMPTHTNYRAWMRKLVELCLSAYSRPWNVDNTTSMYHGKSLSEWLNGSNLEQNHTMVNHDILHPDYMVAILHSVQAAYIFTLAGKATPRAAFHNAEYVYEALVDLNFASPPYDAPGGTIYIDNSSNIYHPDGNDWGTGRRMHYACYDAVAAAFGFDSRVSQKGAYWEALHAQQALDMQARHADGHTYASSSEDSFIGREEWVSMHAAWAYLARWTKAQTAYSMTDATY